MRRVEIQRGVVLLPVLEVEPYHFSRVVMPEGPSRAHRATWSDYFRRCMADAGFVGVEPVAAGSQFVGARSLIDNALLDRLVEEAVVSLDQIPHLSGGGALLGDGELLIQPSCCADLENLREWSRMLDADSPTGNIWIGHPDLAFRKDREFVTLTEQWEYPPPPEYLLEVTVPLDLMAEAVKTAHAQLQLFRVELMPVVARVLGSAAMAERVVSELIGAA